MEQKHVLKPSAAHPIEIEKLGRPVTVMVAGVIIADSRDALVLREAAYSPVIYIPRKDVKMDLLKRSEHTSYCPYKGDASYYNIPSGGQRSDNAVWTYEVPHDSVSQIKDYLAFYPTRVDAIG
jgi:uncharacterized protein (DUF427 family)